MLNRKRKTYIIHLATQESEFNLIFSPINNDSNCSNNEKYIDKSPALSKSGNMNVCVCVFEKARKLPLYGVFILHQ